MNPFDDLAEVYEAMVDWNRRLSNEEPFYRQVFARMGTRQVLDAGQSSVVPPVSSPAEPGG